MRHYLPNTHDPVVQPSGRIRVGLKADVGTSPNRSWESSLPSPCAIPLTLLRDWVYVASRAVLPAAILFRAGHSVWPPYCSHTTSTNSKGIEKALVDSLCSGAR